LSAVGATAAGIWWFHQSEFVTRPTLEASIASVRAQNVELKAELRDVLARVSTLGDWVSELRGRSSSH
jgi:hypothetical protein